MNSCENSIEIIVITLKEGLTKTNTFMEINILLLKKVPKQSMTTRSHVKNILPLQEFNAFK